MNVRQLFFPQKKAIIAAFIVVLISLFSLTAFADSSKTKISGKVYEFEKGHFTFSQSEDSEATGENNTYGKLSVQGDFTSDKARSDVTAFAVSGGNFAIFYDYDDAKLNANENSWHLIDEKSKKVDTITLDSDVLKGALILQISSDGKSWNTVKTVTDAFHTAPRSDGAFYTCTEMQLENGCYYRVIVAYTLSKREKEGKVLFLNTDQYTTKKCAEVYEFYVCSDKTGATSEPSGQIYHLGNKIRVAKFDSFFGEETIDQKDIHYGWDLGDFIVRGFTSHVKDSGGKVVFLKNVGDQVNLSFQLKHNINALNGDEKLTITSAEKVCDQYFETAKTNFGRGALIIRSKDYTGVKTEPQIYTNYLSAYATLDADTTVQLCEEGDYEVALDYEVTKDELIDKVGHYRIFFEFSVRNSNCMVYPMDAVTGSELTNGSVAENGFSLDLAKSRYLDIQVQHSVLKKINGSYVEDVRFNRAAKDGEKYTDEGIYTITVKNRYTGASTTKRIAVGGDSTSLAYVKNDLSLTELNTKLENGFTIQSDGSIAEPISVSTVPSSQAVSSTSSISASSAGKTDQATSVSTQQEKTTDRVPVLPVVGGIAVLGAGVSVIFLKAKKSNTSGNASDGGTDE